MGGLLSRYRSRRGSPFEDVGVVADHGGFVLADDGHGGVASAGFAGTTGPVGDIDLDGFARGEVAGVDGGDETVEVAGHGVALDKGPIRTFGRSEIAVRTDGRSPYGGTPISDASDPPPFRTPLWPVSGPPFRPRMIALDHG